MHYQAFIVIVIIFFFMFILLHFFCTSLSSLFCGWVSGVRGGGTHALGLLFNFIH